jgi:SPP1 gp7 family putative phage head morphogenesis protein
MWRAQEVDGRIAAKNAVKIRAALKQSVNGKAIFEAYAYTQPNVTDNPTQDRARARAWALMNVRVNNESLRKALLRLYAEAWVTGDLAARAALLDAEKAKKSLNKADTLEADVSSINWDTWQPGDAASAMLLDPPKAFQNLVERSGNLITGLDKTGYELIGTTLADAIRTGMPPGKAAKLIENAVGSPARALTIAVTENSRVMNAAAVQRYKDAGVKQMKWMAVTAVGGAPCDKCASNIGQVVEIGASFNSGQMQPPAHPHCRCNLLPEIPDYEGYLNSLGYQVSPTDGAITMPEAKPIVLAQDKLENFSKFQKDQGYTLSTDEIQTLKDYQNTEFTPINKILRIPRATLEKYNEQNYDKLNPVTWRKKQKAIDALNQMITKAPPLEEPIVVFRGIKGDAAKKLAGLRAGSTYKEPGFVSTSMSQEVGYRFMGDEGVLLEIIVPKGTRGVSVEAFLGSPSKEFEWLMAPGTRFKVIEKQGRILKVEVMP